MLNAEGAYDLNVKAFDAIGNGSAASSSFVINFDVTPPALDVPNSPIIGATSFDPAGNIVLKFSEDIRIDPAGGSVSLWSNQGGSPTIGLLDSTQVSISGNTLTINPSSNLDSNASYNVSFLSNSGAVPIQDLAGNAVTNPVLFTFDSGATVLPAARVFFDLTTGDDFTDQSAGRVFEANVQYTIYVKVDSHSSTLTALLGGAWTGGNNLGNDDKIVLVGNDPNGVRLQNGVFVNFSFSGTGKWSWRNSSFGSPNAYPAKITKSGLFVRKTYSLGVTNVANVDLWDGTWGAPYINVTANGSKFATIYHPQLPGGIVNTAGTAFV
jgi:hypothetical protein